MPPSATGGSAAPQQRPMYNTSHNHASRQHCYLLVSPLFFSLPVNKQLWMQTCEWQNHDANSVQRWVSVPRCRAESQVPPPPSTRLPPNQCSYCCCMCWAQGRVPCRSEFPPASTTLRPSILPRPPVPPVLSRHSWMLRPRRRPASPQWRAPG